MGYYYFEFEFEYEFELALLPASGTTPSYISELGADFVSKFEMGDAMFYNVPYAPNWQEIIRQNVNI